MTQQEEENRRKRLRTPLLCDQCRKRKVKCDRNLPCLTCIKNNRPQECDYSGDSVVRTANLDFSNKIGVFRTFAAPSQQKSEKPTNFNPAPISHPGPATGASSSPTWTGQLQLPLELSLVSSLSRVSHPLTSSSGQVMVSELEALKLKVRHLEATLANGGSVSSHSTSSFDRESVPSLANSHDTNSNANNFTYVGVNPYDVNEPDELLDLYDGYNPIQWAPSRQMNYGPCSGLIIMKKDRALAQLSGYLSAERQTQFKSLTPVVPKDATTSREVAIHDDKQEEEFRQKALARDGNEDLAPFTDKDGSISGMKIKMNQNSLALGLTFFEGELGLEVHLIEKIRRVLPSKMALWLLVNRFFESIYPFTPVVDENWFRTEIKRILGPEVYNEEHYETIKVEKRLDLAVLSILLIVLRLSYLSTFSNNKADNDRAINSAIDSPLAETRYILTHPINIDVIAIAQVCLDQFDLYRRTNITVLQCAIIMRIYHLFCPEEGDGSDGGDSHVFNSMCLQIAYSVGLNREPSKYEGLVSDEKKNHIGRKLWYFLRLLDTTQSFQYGFPLSVDDNYSDVNLPYYRPGNSNIIDANLEKAICEGLNQGELIYGSFRHILKLSLSLKNRMKMLELTELLSEFELKLATAFKSLSTFTRGLPEHQQYHFKKVNQCKCYLNSKSFLLTLYFHFFLNYEKTDRSDLAFFYLRKYLAIACGEFLPEYLDLIGNNHANFDPKSTIPDLILSPSIEMLLRKTNQMNFAILIRLNREISVLTQDLEVHNRNMLTSFEYKLRFSRLSSLSKLLGRLCRFGISCLSKLSSRYYYAWRISKAHGYIVDVISKERFRNFMLETNENFVNLSTDQLSELLLIAELSWSGIKSAHHKSQASSGVAATSNEKDTSTLALTIPNATPFVDPFEVGTSVPPNPHLPHADARVNTNGKTDISPTGSLSFDMEDFAMESTVEVDQIWRQLENINNRMGADTYHTLPGVIDEDWKEGWASPYRNTNQFQPLTPQMFGLDNLDNAYELFSHMPMP